MDPERKEWWDGGSGVGSGVGGGMHDTENNRETGQTSLFTDRFLCLRVNVAEKTIAKCHGCIGISAFCGNLKVLSSKKKSNKQKAE